MRLLAPPAAALVLCAGFPHAQAATPAANIWLPTVYSLGGPSLIPVVISNHLDTADSGNDIIVTGRRAPTTTIGTPDFTTPQSVFNVGGDPLTRPANCTEEYTTVGGQPASPTDLTGAAGIHGCYY